MVKKKIYPLLVSSRFPKTHFRAGQPTNFKEQILNGLKIHTGRSNYEFWKFRIDQVNKGEAILSLRQWSGEPYRSKQVEFLQLTSVGLQRMRIKTTEFTVTEKPLNGGTALAKAGKIELFVDGAKVSIPDFAKADGFTSTSDLIEWFPSKWDGALIHFGNFKY